MTRYRFGATAADFTATLTTVLGARVLSPAVAELTFYDAPTGGTRYTDLLVGGQPATSVTTGVDGQVPPFDGPDDVAVMWAGSGSGPRVLMFSPTGILALAGVALARDLSAAVLGYDEENVTGAITVPASGLRVLNLTGDTTVTLTGDNGASVVLDVALAGQALTVAGVEVTGDGLVQCVKSRGVWTVIEQGQASSGGGGETPDPGDTQVTPAAVTFADPYGTANDTYTIPTTNGVDYILAGRSTPKAAGTYPGTGTVTVNAAAQDGYALTGGTYQWTHTFDTTPDPGNAGTVVLADNFNRADGSLNGTQATTGQTWTSPANVANGAISSNRLFFGNDSARAYVDHGTLTDFEVTANIGPGSGQFVEIDAKVLLRTTAADTTGSLNYDDCLGFRVLYREYVPDVVVTVPATGLTVTYNAGGGTSNFATIPGATNTSVEAVKVRLVGTKVTAYVNGTRLLEGTYTQARLDALTGTRAVVRGYGYGDDLQVKSL